MQKDVLNVSENFRKMAVKSVLSIVLFLFTYILLIALGIGIIFLCGFIGYHIVMFYTSFITGMLALGCISMAVLIFFFLIKFIFSGSRKIDRSYLVEITEKEQPALFQMIRELVSEVKTSFPKKVYLSSDVNASVFYDSNFWSMFFPVRKNLQIGLGLMNTISVIELKAILAHEFGHFSQRSMKVGSYVYHVNKVIYNMLYENEGYGSLINRWSNISNYFALFSKGAVLVIEGIQQVLMKVYTILNLNYLALSREMEFHADAVAASVAGSQPLVNSLLRLSMANHSLNIVFDYYTAKIPELQKPGDVYPQQYFVLSQIALLEDLPLQGGLPVLSVDGFKKFNSTKLVLNHQWSSHPSTEERVAKLTHLNLPVKDDNHEIAINLLSGKEMIQRQLTDHLMSNIEYDGEPVNVGPAEFTAEYLKSEQESSLPDIFKRYFDERSPYTQITEAELDFIVVDPQLTFEELINPEIIADISSLKTAEADKELLEKIAAGELNIETFDYDGIKYNAEDVAALLTFLESEIATYMDRLYQRDINLMLFFMLKAREQNKFEDFKVHYLAYQSSEKVRCTQEEIYTALVDAMRFMDVVTPSDQIEKNMEEVTKLEILFKEQIRWILDSTLSQYEINPIARAKFDKYLSKERIYFAHHAYYEEEVQILQNTIVGFMVTVYDMDFRAKRSFLEFQAAMIS